MISRWAVIRICRFRSELSSAFAIFEVSYSTVRYSKLSFSSVSFYLGFSQQTTCSFLAARASISAKKCFYAMIAAYRISWISFFSKVVIWAPPNRVSGCANTFSPYFKWIYDPCPNTFFERISMPLFFVWLSWLCISVFVYRSSLFCFSPHPCCEGSKQGYDVDFVSL